MKETPDHHAPLRLLAYHNINLEVPTWTMIFIYIDLGAVGAQLSPIGAVATMVVGFVWYPVKRLIQRRRFTHATGENPVADGWPSRQQSSRPQSSSMSPAERPADNRNLHENI